jgi:integrase/recombinase XerD
MKSQALALRGNEVIEAFLERLDRAGSRRTVYEYRRVIERFSLEVGDPDAATVLEVQRFTYGVGPSGRLPSPSTIGVRLAALSSLFEFGVDCGTRRDNPAARVRRPRSRPPLPRALEPGEVARLLAAIPRSASGDLDRAVILTILYTALRRREVLSLRLEDLAGVDPVLLRCRVKGGRMRVAPLPEPAMDAITTAWASSGRRAGSAPASHLLFGITSSTFYGHLRRHAVAAGLRPISPHVLRHTAAHLRRQAGASLEEVSMLLGHASLATTALYLRRLEGHQDDRWPLVSALLEGVPSLPSSSPERGGRRCP